MLLILLSSLEDEGWPFDQVYMLFKFTFICVSLNKLYVRFINPIVASALTKFRHRIYIRFIELVINPKICSTRALTFDLVLFRFCCALVRGLLRYPFSWIMDFIFFRPNSFSIFSLRYALSANTFCPRSVLSIKDPIISLSCTLAGVTLYRVISLVCSSAFT